jgi:hypothetical protein
LSEDLVTQRETTIVGSNRRIEVAEIHFAKIVAGVRDQRKSEDGSEDLQINITDRIPDHGNTRREHGLKKMIFKREFQIMVHEG